MKTELIALTMFAASCRCNDGLAVSTQDAGAPTPATESVSVIDSMPLVVSGEPKEAPVELERVDMHVSDWDNVQGSWTSEGGVAFVRFEKNSSGSIVPWTVDIFDGVDSWTCGVSFEGDASCKIETKPKTKPVKADVSVTLQGSVLDLNIVGVFHEQLERIEQE